MQKLMQHGKIKRNGPVVLIIMDGVGIGQNNEGNAYFSSRTPVLDKLVKECMYTTLLAHGTAVGLPSDDDMGNSEVGHNALGAGRIFAQGAKLVAKAIESSSLFESPTWKNLMQKPIANNKALHFIGLFSDGNVHSHIDHLKKMIEKAAASGVTTVNVHILLDGRDVSETSALDYIDPFETFLDSFRQKGLSYKIASGGGRMVTTMDRYEADWNIVKRGWEAHVLGKARPFSSAREAIETYRKEQSGITDQYLPSFTIVNNNSPVGAIQDGDSVIFFNFRGDRAMEISRAFDEKDFSMFDRERYPDVTFAGMMEYDGDLKVPKNYLVFPPDIDRTISEYLANAGVTQFAISETQKFGHVTYFWNGNRTGKFNDSLETYEEIPSDKIEFNYKPWMKAVEITDSVIAAINSNKYNFIRLNLANGDMVGHTGDLEASIIAMETVDYNVGRIVKAIEKAGGLALITADHGNLDEMFEIDKKTGKPLLNKNGEPKKKTSHTLNPVPCIIFDPQFNQEYKLAAVKDPGLGNVAATLLLLLGYNPPADYMPAVIELR